MADAPQRPDPVIPADAPAPGPYIHYKGGYYTVVGVASHSETLEALVVYRDKGGRLWVRPASMWSQPMPDGRPRFERVTSDLEHRDSWWV